MAQHSLLVQECILCVCKCYQEVDDGETRRPVIPLSVFIPSLNSRAATEANGVLIYSWMTHTCHLLGSLNFFFMPHELLQRSNTWCDDLGEHGNYIIYITYIWQMLFPLKVSCFFFFFHPHRKIFGVQGRHVDGRRKKLTTRSTNATVQIWTHFKSLTL